MNKQDLALNNLQGLICHKNQPTSLNDYVCEYTYELHVHTPISKGICAYVRNIWRIHI